SSGTAARTSTSPTARRSPVRRRRSRVAAFVQGPNAARTLRAMFFQKLRDSLANTTKALAGRIRSVVQGRRIDAALWDEVEEVLLTSDVGVEATQSLVSAAKDAAKHGEILAGDDLVPWLRRRMVERLASQETGLRVAPSGPTVVLIAGVNGSGKTTTI